MKKLFLLFASVLLTFVIIQPVQSKGPSLPFDQPEGKPDPGLPWSGKWEVTWVSQDETRFKLQWINPPPNVSCNLIIDVYCLDGPEVDAPKKGDIYVREGNQKC